MILLERVNRVFMVGDQAVPALVNVDLRIKPGEYVAVMGPSGSGKSTLLNILGLLDQPDSGRYLFDGVDTTRMNDTAQALLRGHRIGFVFQAFHLIARLTAAQNVELPLTLTGVAKPERAQRVAATLQLLGLTDRAGHRPDQLSGGQRQRTAIARAIVMQPALLLADEPTGNLDSRSGNEVVAALEALNSGGITLIVVTHDAALGARARRLLRMVDGAIVEDRAQRTVDTPASTAEPATPPHAR
ncbi:MAG: ABC transporter ATP-binding protein [Thiotrichales bacterium]